MPKPGSTNKAENPRAEARETRPESPLTTRLEDQRVLAQQLELIASSVTSGRSTLLIATLHSHLCFDFLPRFGI